MEDDRNFPVSPADICKRCEKRPPFRLGATLCKSCAKAITIEADAAMNTRTIYSRGAEGRGRSATHAATRGGAPTVPGPNE